MATYRSVVGRARRFAEQKDQSTEGVVDGGTKSAATGERTGAVSNGGDRRRNQDVGWSS